MRMLSSSSRSVAACLFLGLALVGLLHRCRDAPRSQSRRLAGRGGVARHKMCKVLKYQLAKGLSVAQAEADWTRLECGKRQRAPEGNGTSTSVSLPQQALDLLKRVFNMDSTSSAAEGEEKRAERAACVAMRDENKVQPGFSWGTLSVADQKAWGGLHCDSFFLESEGDVVDADREWCKHIKKRYSVEPQMSWGSLPFDLWQSWREKRCDSFYMEDKRTSRPRGHCSTVERRPWQGRTPRLNPGADPVIAVLAGSTTRGIPDPSSSSLALCNFLLKSIVRTAECHYQYLFVLGYDLGDPYYDDPEKKNMADLVRWFELVVQQPLIAAGISITLKLVPVNNTIKKPGPVFTAMARAAYTAGADFLYRVNDDTEMLSLWANVLTHTLVVLTPPYGVVGPVAHGTDNRILTHDFVHRTHMEVFDMNYYPPEFTDWWCDDWISVVYGNQRTFFAEKALVTHHTGAHGQRYAVDGSVEKKLTGLVEQGRRMIRKWMVGNGVASAVVRRFDADSAIMFKRQPAPSLP